MSVTQVIFGSSNGVPTSCVWRSDGVLLQSSANGLAPVFRAQHRPDGGAFVPKCVGDAILKADGRGTTRQNPIGPGIGKGFACHPIFSPGSSRTEPQKVSWVRQWHLHNSVFNHLLRRYLDPYTELIVVISDSPAEHHIIIEFEPFELA